MTTAARPLQGVHVVTSYRDAITILRGPGWSSRPHAGSALATALPTLGSALLFADPPEHTRLRRILAPWFSARAVEPLQPFVRSIITTVVDRLDRDVDLVDELARVIPTAVIAELFGLGIDEADILARHTPDLARILEDDPTAGEVEAAADSALALTMMLTPIISARRRHPGNDLLSALLSEPELSLDDILLTTLLLLTAGHETTASFIANSAHALIQERHNIAVLLDSPNLMLDELLRLHGPVKRIGRTALGPHTLSGVHIASGDYVAIDVRRAHRDPGQFPEPEQLDPHRPPTQNLAFGSGIHYCLGAALARMETTETLQLLFARHPQARLTDEGVQWRRSTSFHALSTLPVRL